MARCLLFLSDLHLDRAEPARTARFAAVMAASHRASAVYLLGDLVEAWLGDDDHESPNAELLQALSALRAAGVPVFVQHGNRDFLIGAGFVAATGATLLPEEACIDVDGERVLLMHGDTLCTEDSDYQALRRTVRNPAWQQAALARPLAERRQLARQLRAGSRAAMAGKDAYIMDVAETAVYAALRRHGATTLIHGHTHRPAHHLLDDGAGALHRWVLPDWYERPGLLVWDDFGPRLRDADDFIAGR